MSKYSDFAYGGATYGDIALVSYSAAPIYATALNYKVNGSGTTAVRVRWSSPNNAGIDFVAMKLVRSQDAYPETDTDGVAVFSWDTNSLKLDLDMDDGIDFSAVPLTPGRYVYYRMWMQKATDRSWTPGGDAYCLIPKAHNVSTSATGELLTTHRKVMDLLPRMYTSQSGSPLDEVDTTGDLYNFLSGFSFTYDEMLTYADLLIPEASGSFQNPNTLLAQIDQLGIPLNMPLVTKSQKRLAREALYIYSRKGTKLSLGTLAESITSYDQTITVSPNLMLTNQDSTFYKSVGFWLPQGNCTIASVNDTLPPTLVQEPNAVDLNYVGKVVVSTAGAKISNGDDAPRTHGIPVDPSTSYSFSFYVTSATTNLVTAAISWYDFAGTFISTTTDSSPANATGSWVKHTMTATAPTGAHYASVAFTFAATGTYFLDMIQFAASTVTTFNEARGVKIVLQPERANLVTNPSFEASSGTVTVRTNLITNPSFEVNLTGWSPWATATLTRITTDSYVGSACMQVTMTTATGYEGASTSSITVTNGSTYTASAWVKAPVGYAYCFYLSDSVNATQVNYTGTGSWQYVTATRTVLSTNLTVMVLKTAAVAGTLLVDAVIAESGTVAGTYFDGSTSASGDFSYAWSGTANASTSLQTGRAVTGVGAGGLSPIQSTSFAYVGSNSLRIIPTTSAGSADVANLTYTPGLTYTLSAYVNIPTALSGSPTLWFGVRQWGSSVPQQYVVVPNTVGTQRVSLTFIAPSDATSLNARFWLNTTPFGGDVYIDGLMLEQSSTVNQYFDGSYGAEWGATWGGTANASASYYYPNRATKLPALLTMMYNNIPTNTPYSIELLDGTTPIRGITY